MDLLDRSTDERLHHRPRASVVPSIALVLIVARSSTNPPEMSRAKACGRPPASASSTATTTSTALSTNTPLPGTPSSVDADRGDGADSFSALFLRPARDRRRAPSNGGRRRGHGVSACRTPNAHGHAQSIVCSSATRSWCTPSRSARGRRRSDDVMFTFSAAGADRPDRGPDTGRGCARDGHGSFLRRLFRTTLDGRDSCTRRELTGRRVEGPHRHPDSVPDLYLAFAIDSCRGAR